MPTVTIQAPCRLHFGLYSFGRGVPQFGGVGVMVSEPQLLLRISPHPHLEFLGPNAHRLKAFFSLWHERESIEAPSVRVELLHSPPEHQGLGLGTALGMSMAAGLRRFHGLEDADAPVLAASVGRGRRSAVGAYGFCLGGFIAEAGRPACGDDVECRANNDEIHILAPLEERIASPESWHFVLTHPPESPGISGDNEAKTFAALPPVPAAARENLLRVAHQRLLPAIKDEVFSEFASALYDFGRLAGECFSPVQGGPYRGPVVTEIVEKIRSWGNLGVGQSSWGPTIYTATPSLDTATELAALLQQWRPEMDVTVTDICNRGARCEVAEELG